MISYMPFAVHKPPTAFTLSLFIIKSARVSEFAKSSALIFTQIHLSKCKPI